LDSRDQVRRVSHDRRGRRGEHKAFTRNGHDWSAKYAPIVDEAASLKCRTAILDGEMVVQDENGVSDFAELRSAIRWSPQRLILYAFDLLMIDGMDLRRKPLIERRQHLQSLVGGNPRSHIHFSTNVTGNGREFFEAADRLGLEGIVSKRPDSRYVSDRTKLWLKCKTFALSDFELLGVPRPEFRSRCWGTARPMWGTPRSPSAARTATISGRPSTLSARRGPAWLSCASTRRYGSSPAS
jgi:ATP-dependent DNA ligase